MTSHEIAVNSRRDRSQISVVNKELLSISINNIADTVGLSSIHNDDDKKEIYSPISRSFRVDTLGRKVHILLVLDSYHIQAANCFYHKYRILHVYKTSEVSAHKISFLGSCLG